MRDNTLGQARQAMQYLLTFAAGWHTPIALSVKTSCRGESKYCMPCPVYEEGVVARVHASARRLPLFRVTFIARMCLCCIVPHSLSNSTPPTPSLPSSHSCNTLLPPP